MSCPGSRQLHDVYVVAPVLALVYYDRYIVEMASS